MKKITRRKLKPKLKVIRDLGNQVIVSCGRNNLEITPLPHNNMRMRFQGQDMGVVKIIPEASNAFKLDFVAFNKFFKEIK